MCRNLKRLNREQMRVFDDLERKAEVFLDPLAGPRVERHEIDLAPMSEITVLETAVSIGGTVPLLLKRFNVDPAVASGPVLTTVTDMCGFFLVLGFATVSLPYIT